MVATEHRIVIVEDHRLVREGLKLNIAVEPDLVVAGEAASLEEARGMISSMLPDLLILDMDLAGNSAWPLIAFSRSVASTIRILVVTGTLRPDSAREALAAGAHGYVHKSDDSVEIIAAIRAVLGGRNFVSKVIADGMALTAPAVHAALTAREREILQKIAAGLSSQEIAAGLNISPLTVRTHRRNLMEKLQLHNAAELTAYALRTGISP